MKITEIHLQTSKLDELKLFYGDLLNFKVEFTSPDNIILHTGQTRIVFKHADINDPFYHFAFTIPSNKINEAYNWLKQRVELLWIPDYNSFIADFINWNAQSVYFKDPAGNIVEFIARFDLQDHESANFSAEQIRSVSEIGLVFPYETYSKNNQAILSEYSLTYFSKHPPLASFSAIGDEEGLLISVPEGRAWYPTSGDLAGIYTMKILFEIEGKEYVFST